MKTFLQTQSKQLLKVALIFYSLLMSFGANSAVRYVTPTGDLYTGSGTSSLAPIALERAIYLLQDDDVIYMLKGDYSKSSGYNYTGTYLGGLAISISNVKIYGGFNSFSETVLTRSKIGETIISRNSANSIVLAISCPVGLVIDGVVFNGGTYIAPDTYSSVNSTLTGIIITPGGLTLSSRSITFNKCVFKNFNTSTLGAAINVSGNILTTFTNSTAIDNQTSLSGAFLYMTTYQKLIISNCLIKNNTAKDRGGAIYINATSLLSILSGVGNDIDITKTTFEDNKTLTSALASVNVFSGGAIYFEGYDLVSGLGLTDILTRRININVSECKIKSNIAGVSGSGGAFYFDMVKNVTFHKDTIEGNQSGNTGGFATIKNVINVSLTSSIVNNNSSKFQGGALYIYDASLVSSGSNAISVLDTRANNNTLTDISSILTTNGGAFLYYGNSSLLTAVLSDLPNVSVKNSTLSNNIVSNSYANGGALSLSNCNAILLDSCKITSNSCGGSGGGIYLYNNGKIKMDTVYAQSNTASTGSGGFLSTSTYRGLDINNSKFKLNTAKLQGGTFNLVDVRLLSILGPSISDINIEKSEFENNETTNSGALQGGGAIFFKGVDLLNGGLITGLNVTNILTYRINANVNNCLFQGNKSKVAGSGGAFYLYNMKNINITNTSALENTAKGDGGFLFVNDLNELNVINGKYDDNVADLSGGVFYTYVSNLISTGTNKFTIRNIRCNNNSVSSSSPLIGNFGGGFLYYSNGSLLPGLLTGFPNIKVSKSQFTNNKAITANANGGVFNLSNINLLNIDSCKAISNNTAHLNGGVVFVYNNNAIAIDSIYANANAATNGNGGFLHTSTYVGLTVSRAKFNNHLAKENGGVFSLMDARLLSILGVPFQNIYLSNCEFRSNETTATSTSLQGGGVLYFKGIDLTQSGIITGLDITNLLSYRLDVLVNNCLFDLNKSKSFGSGGAFNVFNIRDFHVLNSNITNHSAGSNGGFIAVSDFNQLNLRNGSYINNIAAISGGSIYSFINNLIPTGTSKITVRNIHVDSSKVQSAATNLLGHGGGFLYHNNIGLTAGILSGLPDVRISRSNFNNNKANSINANGGAFYLSNVNYLEMDSCKIVRNNLALNHGGVFYINSSNKVKMDSVVGYKNYASNGSGGFLYSTTYMGLDLYRGYFKENEANHAGGVFYLNDTRLLTSLGDSATFKSCRFYNNKTNNTNAQSLGGGVVYYNNTTLTTSLLDLALLAYRPTFTFKNTKFFTNSVNGTSGSGGALNLTNVSHIRFIACDSLINNSASTNGGFMSANNFGHIYVNDATIKGNTSSMQGGAFYLYELSLLATVGHNVHFTNSTLTHNTVHQAANSYTKVGGGFLFYDNATLLGALTSNDINGAPDFVFSGCTIQNNQSLSNHGKGGFCSLYNVKHIDVLNCNEIKNNTAVHDGGVFYLFNNGDFTIRNTQVSLNQAGNSGGFAYNEDYGLLGLNLANITNLVTPDFTVFKCLFTDNQAIAGDGGVFKLNTVDDFKIDSTVFTGNTSYDKGGAIYLVRHQHLDLNTSEFNSNVAGKMGGAIFVTEIPLSLTIVFGKNIDVNHCLFHSNSTSDSTGGGGAMYLTYMAHIEVLNSQFISNTATGIGGAIYSLEGTLATKYRNCLFRSNRSTAKNGGAIHAFVYQLNIDDSKFFDNTAHLDGGAIYVTGQNYMNACEFQGNVANLAGGAIYVNVLNAVVLPVLGTVSLNFNYSQNCIYGGNVSGLPGSCIAMSLQESYMRLLNCTFSGNKNVPVYRPCILGVAEFLTGSEVINTIFHQNEMDPDFATNVLYRHCDFYPNFQQYRNFHLAQGHNLFSDCTDGDPVFYYAPSFSYAPFTNGDYHLKRCSAAIDAGTNNFFSAPISGSIIPALSEDIEKLGRIVNVIDLGAHESRNLDTLYHRYVDVNSHDNGFNWNKAGSCLQTMIYSSCSGDTIFVRGGNVLHPNRSPNLWSDQASAQGTIYHVDSFQVENSFLMKSGVHIYGGFTGTERYLKERVLSENNFTYLSGNLQVSTNTHAQSILTAYDLITNTVLDGFVFQGALRNSIDTVKNGLGTPYLNWGTAISVNNSKLTIANSIIRGNESQSSVSTKGAAIHARNSSVLNLYNTVVSGNKSTDGGIIQGVNSELKIINSTIVNNQSSLGISAAIHNDSTSVKAQIHNSIIYGNAAGFLGDTTKYMVSFSTIQDNLFGLNNQIYQPSFLYDVDRAYAPTILGDYRVTKCSQTINRGSNALYDYALSNPYLYHDAYSLLRVQHTDIDQGAFESVTSSEAVPPFKHQLITELPLCYGSVFQTEVQNSTVGIQYKLETSSQSFSPVLGTGSNLILTSNGQLDGGNYTVIGIDPVSLCDFKAESFVYSCDSKATSLPAAVSERKCFVHSNSSFVDFAANGELIARVTPNGQDLSYITLKEFIESDALVVQSCAFPGGQFDHAALKRHWVLRSDTNLQVFPSSLGVQLFVDSMDVVNLNIKASQTSNTYDAVASLNDLALHMYVGADVDSLFTNNCVAGSTTIIPNTSHGFSSNIYANISNSNFVNFSVGGASEFWLASNIGNSPLPVNLSDYTIQCKEGDIVAKWTSLTETNIDIYRIESSSDMVNWRLRDEVKATGSPSHGSSYTSTFGNDNQMQSYIRLTAYNSDGDLHHTELKSLQCGTDEVSVYPNPMEDFVQIQFADHLEKTIHLMDLSGKVLMQTTSSEMLLKLELQEYHLSPGMYYLQVQTGSGEKLSFKLYKK